MTIAVTAALDGGQSGVHGTYQLVKCSGQNTVVVDDAAHASAGWPAAEVVAPRRQHQVVHQCSVLNSRKNKLDLIIDYQ